MPRYQKEIVKKVRILRSYGNTYSEIKEKLGLIIPKSTLSDWCKDVVLPLEYSEKIVELNKINSNKGRVVALVANKIKRKILLEGIKNKNVPIAKEIHNVSTAKIALAMLCLGEASKSNNGSSFYLGSSDIKIIMIFLNLLKLCFTFDLNKIRCTVQCRADQDTRELEKYWQKETNIPEKLFYPSRIDARTIGKPTKKKDYKGVLRVDYFDSNVRLELEAVADLVYNETVNSGL